MTTLEKITVHAETEDGPYMGSLELAPGLNVITAANGFGKTLASTAIAWCLRLEPIFGVAHDDPRIFSRAVLSELSSELGPMVPVLSSWAELTLRVEDGSTLVIRRSIKGGDCTRIEVARYGSDRNIIERVSLRSRAAFADEVGGFQPYMYNAMGLPRQRLLASNGRESWLYFENIAPLFFVEQINGWTGVAATQVHRYRLIDVNAAAVEYLVGAQTLLDARVVEQTRSAREAELRAEVQSIREQAEQLLTREGWTLDLGVRTSLKAVLNRWRDLDLKLSLRDRHAVDFASERRALDSQADEARKQLSGAKIDAAKPAVWNQTSREVLDLKRQRTVLAERSATLRFQLDANTTTLKAVENQIQATKDLLRLKAEGIGVLPAAECPTCHRELELATFQLKPRSADEIRTHIESLETDRRVVLKALETDHAGLAAAAGALDRIEDELRDRQRTLASIDAAAGPQREAIARAAHALAAAERSRGKLNDLERDIGELQRRIRAWVVKADRFLAEAPEQSMADRERIAILRHEIADALVSIGHTGVDSQQDGIELTEDDHQPLFRGRAVRSLGSGSDHARLVHAYATSLLRTALLKDGNHPGFVVLDEPLQQNPDQKHVRLAIKVWGKLASWLDAQQRGQVVIFTVLNDGQTKELAKAGALATVISGRHFLRRVDVPAGE